MSTATPVKHRPVASEEICRELVAWKQRDLPVLQARYGNDVGPVELEQVLDKLADEALASESFLSRDASGRRDWWVFRRNLRPRDYLKSGKHTVARSLELMYEEGQELATRPSLITEHPGLADLTSKEHDTAIKVTRKLKKNDRELLHLYLVDRDFSREEIADALGISKRQASRRFKDALNRFHHHMATEKPTGHCQSARELMDGGIDALNEQEARWFDEHLSECKHCVSYQRVHAAALLLLFAPAAPWLKERLSELLNLLHLRGSGSGAQTAAGAVAGTAASAAKLAGATKLAAIGAATLAVGAAAVSQLPDQAGRPKSAPAAASAPSNPAAATAGTRSVSRVPVALTMANNQITHAARDASRHERAMHRRVAARAAARRRAAKRRRADRAASAQRVEQSFGVSSTPAPAPTQTPTPPAENSGGGSDSSPGGSHNASAGDVESAFGITGD